MSDLLNRWKLKKISDYHFEVVPEVENMMKYTSEMAMEITNKIYEHEQKLIFKCIPDIELNKLKIIVDNEIQYRNDKRVHQ